MIGDVEKRTEAITRYFQNLIDTYNEVGEIGFTSFSQVYDSLIPSQKEKLMELTGEEFNIFYRSGSFISFCIAYDEEYMSKIDPKKDSESDYELWNDYAIEYHRINQVLNEISFKIAKQFEGTPLTATIGGVIQKVQHVQDYFPMVVSHRAIAEKAGLGWIGKNQLLIHEKYSCALRFASAIVKYPLVYGGEIGSKCGDCTACEEVCSFIKYREQLTDYRENCRRYILFLKSKGIEKDVCGKCIKACYQSSFFRNQFLLRK